jgi:hypothetical protein
VRVPRFRIAWVMFAVAIAALNFGAIRACFDSPFAWNEFVLLGALPMANVLGLGLLIAQQRPKSRPFLLGFVTFGAAALALYVALLILLTDPSGASTTYGDLINWYIGLADYPIGAAIALDRRFLFTLVFIPVVVVMLGWPQLAFALIGGFLSRRYKVTITRR